MAYEGENLRHALPANADLSASQWCGVVVHSSGKVAVAGAGVRIDGVLVDTPAAADRTATYVHTGVVKVKAGAAITNGDLLKTTTGGKFITAGTTGNVAVAQALAAASGDGSYLPAQL